MADKVNWETIDQGLVERHAALVGISVGGDVRTQVQRLQAEYLSSAKKSAGSVKLGSCDRCGLKSPATLDVCPFCGEGGIEVEGADKASPGPVKASEGDLATSTSPANETARPSRKRTKTAPVISTSEGPKVEDLGKKAKEDEDIERAAIVASNASDPVTTIEPSSSGSDPVDGKDDAFDGADEEVPMEATNGIVSANGAGGQKLTQYPKSMPKTLDAALERIRAIGRKSGEDLYDLGAQLRNIYDTEMWKRDRVDAKTKKPLYSNFTQFVDAEFKKGATAYVYKLIGGVKTHSRDEFAEFGSKILEVARLPAADRTKLLEEVVEKKLTKRETASRAKEMTAAARERGEAPTQKNRSASAKTKTNQGKKPAEKKHKAVTIEPSASLQTVAFPTSAIKLPLTVHGKRDKAGKPMLAKKLALDVEGIGLLTAPGANFEIKVKFAETAKGLMAVVTVKKK